MRPAAYIPWLFPVVLLGGCVFGPKQPNKVSAAPLPPKPATTAPASVAPASPVLLSIPQTVAELPAPQPISPDALATLKQPEEPAESQPGPRVPPRRGPVAGPPRAEPAPAAAQPQTPQPPPPEQVERPPITEILPEAEKKRLQESADARKRDIKKVLDQTDPRRLNNAQKDLVARIRTLVQQSDEAGTRNDWRQADALAGQALFLVRELQGGR